MDQLVLHGDPGDGPAEVSALRLPVSLNDIVPPIWRRFRVEDTITFGDGEFIGPQRDETRVKARTLLLEKVVVG